MSSVSVTVKRNHQKGINGLFYAKKMGTYISICLKELNTATKDRSFFN